MNKRQDRATNRGILELMRPERMKQKTCRPNKSALLGLGAAALIALTGCQTATSPGSAGIEAARLDASAQRSATESSRDSLQALDQLYKSNSSDPDIATRYARALRENGRLERAGVVLAPVARNESRPHAAAKTEFAALQAAQGNYSSAEDFARQAVMLEPESGLAYHVLGIALDAQGHHKQAEVALRKALELWDGDPSSPLNNLGLNLAAQGFIDEALETLRRAQALSPERVEIERNIRIVSALQYTPPLEGSRLVPSPPRKPGADIFPLADQAEG